MDTLIIFLGWIGLFSTLALPAIGSTLGCTRAGQAAIGAMLEVNGGYGRFVGVSAMPSSQTIYGVVMMMVLKGNGVSVERSPGLFAVGIAAGIAMMMSAIMQGECAASAINVSKSKPEVFGVSVAPAAIVEGFAIFVLVFTLVLAKNIG
ncbi:MAG TPA: V-type ATP synthase subunit K [Rhodospirillaceae bacterium]|nr:MAG: V-type ATP synthase subunit K [Alphaproteobacteria bacterium GWF2_58_20]HAU29861.1 V-type ATP synthase subunit K [Rhodospirillaceae bacterium]